MEYLFLTLRAPLQSWGTHAAVGERRPTADHPGRSAVVGLLAAALGIRRDQPEKLLALHQGLRLAVREDDGGKGRLLDYHTTQVPPAVRKRVFYTRRDELVSMLGHNDDVGTVLSWREYLITAMFTVALRSVGEDVGATLEDMYEALKRPRLPLYFGRKSCPPGFPLMPFCAQAASLEEAFACYDAFRKELLDKEKLVMRISQPMRIWSDTDDFPDRRMALTVRDVLRDVRRRQFEQRQEYAGFLGKRHSGGEEAHVHQQS
ncbi:MAG: type I-E CRISPR-associated protein Cas5/CasD [bacterium]|nr:type I-E CRISPR-associated protein Cas5/CasD [bacterium]